MDKANLNKIMVYTSLGLVVGAFIYFIVYPFGMSFFEKKTEVILTNTSVDKAFFEKLENLKDNSVEFNKEIKPTNNPFEFN